MDKKQKALIFSCKDKIYAEAVEKVGFSVYSANTEADMFLNLREISYDLLVVDAEYSKAFYGTAMVSAVAKMKANGKPYVIAISDVSSEYHHSSLKDMGADAVIYRENAEKELSEKAAESKWKNTDTDGTPSRIKTEQQVFDTLTEMGFSEKNKGSGYLAQAITAILYTPEMIKQLSKTVYPYIAERNSTTSSAVERSIRFEISKISDYSNAKFIKSEIVKLKKMGLPYR